MTSTTTRPARRRLALAAALAAPLVGIALAGADCVPELGIAEAADCCACLAKTTPAGGQARAADNCLPDDLSQGFDQAVEEQQCAADAGDSLSSDDVVVVDLACLEEGAPCAALCARAAELGVDFAERD